MCPSTYGEGWMHMNISLQIICKHFVNHTTMFNIVLERLESMPLFVKTYLIRKQATRSLVQGSKVLGSGIVRDHNDHGLFYLHCQRHILPSEKTTMIIRL
eukprot:TRINITY_DN22807_c0_g2_i1.p1 TRINITY_DN22807_c0_g2~~TRINITY_DN22807_c0_g2_i1.p1  ORF type:complete len:100 (+),score=0.87 TRINITY_DN22807_c0_g2_i1:669-968(+)